MASTVNNMGIGPLGNVAFKRKYRWLFSVENVGGGGSNSFGVSGKYVKAGNRPNLEIDDGTEINFLNGKTWLPGKATFQSIEFTYYDVAVPGDLTVTNLLRWVNRVYNFASPASGVANSTEIAATQRSYAVDPTGAGNGYAGTGKLLLLDGCGYVLETWTLVNCWPQSINFGDLSYSESGECDIAVTLRYSYAKYESNCAPLAGELCSIPVCGSAVGANF
jgi:hypothetical protein